VRISNNLGALEGSAHLGPRHVRVTERPQCPAQNSHFRDTDVATGRPSRQAFGFVAHIELGETPLDHPPCFNEAPHSHQHRSDPAHRVERGRPVASRFGEPERSRGCVQRFGHRAAVAMHECQPIRYVGILRRITEPLTKLAGAREGCCKGAREEPLGGDQARSQRELEVELEPVLACAIRQAADSLDAAAQMGDRLDIGIARDGDFAGAQPITRCFFG